MLKTGITAAYVSALSLVQLAPVLAGDEGLLYRVPTPLENAGAQLFVGYDPDAEAAANISGVVCFEDNSCLVVADEMVIVQRLNLRLNDGAPGYAADINYSEVFLDICPDIANRKPNKRDECKEVDLEGIARSGQQVLVTGSMGNRRKKGVEAKERWFIAQFEIDDAGRPVSSTRQTVSKPDWLMRLFIDHEEIEDHLNKPLQCDGLNIEGLARVGDSVFFGLRSPALRRDRQAMLVRSPASLLAAEKEDDIPDTELLMLSFRDSEGRALKNIGIRALEPLGERLLIVTGDSRVSSAGRKHADKVAKKCGDNLKGASYSNTIDSPDRPRIWIWDPATERDPVEIAALAGSYGDEKLEGIAVIGGSDNDRLTIDLLLAVDDPGEGAVALSLLPQVSVPAR